MDVSAITLRQLRYLVALAETCNFRRAAERCGISQPSLSAQIQNIEGALAVRLLERSRARVVLTPVGREVVERARGVLDDVQGLADFASVAQQGLMGTIRLGVKPTLGPYLLPQVAAVLHREHPDLKLHVREDPPRELEPGLISGRHDLVLAQLPVASAELTVQRLFREPLMLALAEDHPLAGAEEIDASDLEGESVLSLNPQYHLHDQISGLCRDFGATVMREYEGTSLDALRTMVGMGMGVTFLPALYVRSEIAEGSTVVVRRLRGRQISRSIGLVWRKSAGRSAGYRQIASVIQRVAAEQFPELTLEG